MSVCGRFDNTLSSSSYTCKKRLAELKLFRKGRVILSYSKFD